MGQVQGKVALVTGAAAGIGAAIATTLGREGATVVSPTSTTAAARRSPTRSAPPGARRSTSTRT